MITIIGSGKVGGDAALFTALKRLDDEILLLDIAEGLPQGEAMDINHALSELGIDVEVRGSNDYGDMEGSRIVVMVAGAGRKPGMTRMDLLKINASIAKDVVSRVGKFAPDSLLIPVTNPLDPVAYIAQRVSGFEPSRVFGMGGMLDLSRFKQFIHEATGCSRDSIDALVIGEHGEAMLPLPRHSSVSGIPLTSMLNSETIKDIVQKTREVAARVIKLKGATVHAPGNAISAMIQAIVQDQKKVIPVSTVIDGEYGHDNISIGVPAVIGRRGVERIIELDLDDAEKTVFDAAAKNVADAITGIDL